MLRDIIAYIISSLAGVALTLVLSVIIIGQDNTLSAFAAIKSQLDARTAAPIFQAQVLGISNTNDTEDLGAATDFIINPNELKSSGLPYPLIVPTDGIAGSNNHLYSAGHVGIDIWTQTNGKGLNRTSKGNPVYAACSGLVTRVYLPNEEIEIVCDTLPSVYTNLVPSLKIKTLYAHMGDALSDLNYHSLRVGQKVKRGELIGYQGNRSSLAPQNRVTHLHFGIYDLSKSGRRPTINPAIYIGTNTTKYLQEFKTGQQFYED